MPDLKEKLIVALDVDTLQQAEKIVKALGNRVKFYKIGSQLFTACGPKAVEVVAACGAKAFLDLKYYDIPNTVYAAVSLASANPAVFMMTVHIAGGIVMLKQAAEAASQKSRQLNSQKPLIVGVTRLTSEPAGERDVLAAAKIAQETGLDGVVCSALEAQKIRKEFGEKFIIVTPGIRPKGYPADDQKRVTTAKEAIEAGANYIVVGRPILEAKDPLRALDDLLD